MSREVAYLEVDPSDVRFTHARVRPFFSGCGRRLKATLEDLKSGRMELDDLPTITVLRGADGSLFSLNNRRLWVLKELRRAGVISAVRVRVRLPLPREVVKYSTDRCSLTATLMREKNREGVALAEGSGDDDQQDSSDHENKAVPRPLPPSIGSKPLHPTIMKSVRQLQGKLNKKGKGAVFVQRQVDEWIDGGVLDVTQEGALWALIRGQSAECVR